MADIPSPTPQTPLQPGQGAPTPPSPQLSPVSHHHKTLFILGSLFVVVMLLAVSGMLYFQNYSAPVAQGSRQEAVVTPIQFNWTPILQLKDSSYFSIQNDHIIALGWDLGTDTEDFLVATDQNGKSIPYAKDKNMVYTQEWLLSYPHNGTIPDVDPTTFYILSEGYVKDSSHVWFDTTFTGSEEPSINLIEGADPATFEVSSTTNSFDAQDKNHKYLQGQVVGTTNAQTSSDINWIWYSNDKNATSSYLVKNNSIYVYHGTFDELVKDADPTTFKVYEFVAEGGEDQFGVDANHVWFFEFPMESADLKTFTVFNTMQHCDKQLPYPAKNYYNAADRNHTYYQNQQMDCPSPIK